MGCVAGAVTKEKYLDAISSAGFEDVQLIEEVDFPLDCMVADPHGQAILKGLEGSVEEIKRVVGSISSIKVSGRKPVKR